ncbi:hypothetical protein SKTS_12750 [Sulfurimicrobium lacus]|uniref:Dicarboxylate transport domain-containing protein n=2 Tax=Sulfurimicrobium lacus TaxID=2715678 RepID=A0A6F8VCC6_9PROT|nr:hypothetical protein SKTS_12750 [Sulfurimicrobium lacus]
MLTLAAPAFAQQIALHIEDIAAPTFQASGISAELESSRFTATIKQLSVQGHDWKNVRLTCPAIILERDTIACTQGTLTEEQSWPVRFSYAPGAKQLMLDLSLPAREHWHVEARWGKRWDIAANIDNGKAAHFRTWLPQDMPAPSAGVINGKLNFSGSDTNLLAADMDLRLAGIAFSDTSGLHAGEKISGKVRLTAHPVNRELVWQGEALWDQGEIYWDPLYLTGGARLSARGRLDPQRVTLAQASLHWPAIGDISASGSWDRTSRSLSASSFQGTQLALDPLYRSFALPFLGKTALAKSAASGKMDIAGRFAEGKIQSLDLTLDHAALQDKDGRFALRDVHLKLPWRAQAATSADFGVGGGQVLSLPLGGFTAAIQMQDKKFSTPRLDIPLLGGALGIENFQATSSPQGWRWEFEGGLTPVSMEQLSAALHWPKMHGTLAGVVPRVRYDAGKLTLDGALLIKAFDGTAVIQDLALLDALGPAPRLQANIDMRNLDLDLLTRTFSFGSMQGRIDVSVKGLELSNWKPVAFDGSVRSSPGDYPRKISQRAVQNISSLGGAGAAAAIQRSFLGIFEQFGYSQLGLSCVLKNGVCHMGGIAPAPNGYIIVKGGGIPAITVIGYNPSVSWDELITRLQRVTQGNSTPVVQ